MELFDISVYETAQKPGVPVNTRIKPQWCVQRVINSEVYVFWRYERDILHWIKLAGLGRRKPKRYLNYGNAANFARIHGGHVVRWV